MRWLLDKPTAACCAVLVLLQTAVGSPVQPNPVIDLLPRQTIIPGGKPCGQNNATNRGCWKNNWNISTDYEFNTPPAFNTRTVCLHAPVLQGVIVTRLRLTCTSRT
jgi:hypothetical protein